MPWVRNYSPPASGLRPERFVLRHNAHAPFSGDNPRRAGHEGTICHLQSIPLDGSRQWSDLSKAWIGAAAVVGTRSSGKGNPSRGFLLRGLIAALRSARHLLCCRGQFLHRDPDILAILPHRPPDRRRQVMRPAANDNCNLPGSDDPRQAAGATAF
jgi:hypothetical protein